MKKKTIQITIILAMSMMLVLLAPCTKYLSSVAFAEESRILNNTQQFSSGNSELMKKNSGDSDVDRSKIQQEVNEGTRVIVYDESVEAKEMDKLKQAECPHANDFVNGKCKDCGMECLHVHVKTVCADCGAEIGCASTGSVFSEGKFAIITAVAGVAFGFVCGLLICKKNKHSSLVNPVEEKNEDRDI